MTHEISPGAEQNARRERYSGWRVPFVEAARDGVVLEIEETPDYSAFRREVLAEAGIIASTEPSASNTVRVDPDDARARRLAEPHPDLIILCRLQIEAGLAIRTAERELHLPHVPILVAGGRPIEELIECARVVAGDAVLRMPGHGEGSSTPGGLVEAALRLGWPSGFARACAESGEDVAARPWPEGTASVLSGAATLNPDVVKAMRAELGGRIYDCVSSRWMISSNLGQTSSDEERARLMSEAQAIKSRLNRLISEGVLRGLLTQDQAADLRGDAEVPATLVALAMTGQPFPHRFSLTPEGSWLEEAFTPRGWVPLRVLPPPASSDPNDLIGYLVLGKGRRGRD
jgi:hypothetical protein